MNKTNKRDLYIIRINSGEVLETARSKYVARDLLHKQTNIQRRSDLIIEKQ